MRPVRFLRDLFARRQVFAAGERRSGPRVRTRLRPGKLVDEHMGFVADCAILDRTVNGARIRCFGAIERLDETLGVFDEKDGTLRQGRVVWHRAGEAGLRLNEGEPVALDPKLLRRLSAPYYAVAE